MTLIRTLTAQCDDEANACDEYIELNPNDSQPFWTLTENGWASHTRRSEDDTLTFCPKHKEQAQ